MTRLEELPKAEQQAIEASRMIKVSKGIVNLNEHGKELIKAYERLKLESYKDSGGVWSIAFGQTTNRYIEVKEGMTVTEAEANNLFNQHLSLVTIPLLCVELRHEDELNDFQFSALCSLVYNSGSMKVRHGGKWIPSPFMEALNNKQFDWAGLLMKKHDIRNRKGKVLLGLKRRRMCEYWLYTQHKTDEYEPKDWVKAMRRKAYNDIKKV